MYVIHRFREQKMLKLLNFNAFWVNKKHIFVLFNNLINCGFLKSFLPASNMPPLIQGIEVVRIINVVINK